MGQLTRNGNDGRVYGGDAELIHVKDGMRATAGIAVADFVDTLMRAKVENRTDEERADQALCPGCYMVVMFNAMMSLADRTGQPRKELIASMVGALKEFSADPDSEALREEICVLLDPE